MSPQQPAQLRPLPPAGLRLAQPSAIVMAAPENIEQLRAHLAELVGDRRDVVVLTRSVNPAGADRIDTLVPTQITDQGPVLWEDGAGIGLTLSFVGLAETLQVASWARDADEDTARHHYLDPTRRVNLTRVDVSGWPRRPAAGDRIQVERWDARGTGTAITVVLTSDGPTRGAAARIHAAQQRTSRRRRRR